MEEDTPRAGVEGDKKSTVLNKEALGLPDCIAGLDGVEAGTGRLARPPPGVGNRVLRKGVEAAVERVPVAPAGVDAGVLG